MSETMILDDTQVGEADYSLRATIALVPLGIRDFETRPRIDQLESLINSHRTLQTITTQQAWDMRSLELTVEKLRGEVAKWREFTEMLTIPWALHGIEYEHTADADYLEWVIDGLAALEGGE